ncbi:MaoC family dehydratase N-terminal domain-containing protein [uncultured Agrococcus sp.]|uniref:FAS1-like dehydratase domain-containing protein n=1 Tax=uncultured Agrococcus sp. TaxID=382258 RepID=UPI0025CDB26B|nr:MaoC family dehydratase N-terminal domain-containing protein [uncultured Agrococcus sp.]
MSVNTELAGKEYPPTEPYLVGREKIREFAGAVQASNPVHFNVDAATAAGYDDLVAPPTFTIVVQQRGLDQLLADDSAGIELHRVVHGDQRFNIVRPILAGDELTVKFRVATVRPLGGNAMVSTEADILDAAGVLVATSYATLVVGGDE